MPKQYNKVDDRKFTPLKADVMWLVTFFILYPFYTIFYRPTVYGEENLPIHEKRVLIASNHLSNADPTLLVTYTQRPISFLAKKELFNIPLFGDMLYFFTSIEVDRDNLKVSTIKSAKKILDKGWWLSIFPEGTRNKTNNPLGDRIHEGFAAIAKATGATVVPVAIKNTNRLFGPVRVKFGKPFKIDDVQEGVRQWKESVIGLLNEI